MDKTAPRFVSLHKVMSDPVDLIKGSSLEKLEKTRKRSLRFIPLLADHSRKVEYRKACNASKRYASSMSPSL